MDSLMKKAMNRFRQKCKDCQWLFLVDSLLINGAYLITGRIYLSGYAIFLGAGDFLTALLNSTANYATLLSIVSFFIFERMANRKKLLLALNFLSRTFMAMIAIVPLVFPDTPARLIFLTLFVILSEVTWGIYRIGWAVWMMTMIQRKAKSKYIYSEHFTRRIFMWWYIARGFFTDLWDKSYTVILSFSSSAICSH